MPGIAGIISKTQKEKNSQDLRLMIDCMMHESFYTSGVYADDQFGIYIGWVSHQHSFSDCMPIHNEAKDAFLFFSGEVFSDEDVAHRLKNKGHRFESTNASYLIHLYEEEGEGFLKQLNGWFSGLLLDLRKNQAYLFNDRYGMQKIYYHEGRDAFLFSSEAKSLLKVRPQLRNIDMESLGQFFSCGTTLENRSLFASVFLLPGGSKWVFNNGASVRKECYFRPGDWENQPILGKEAFYTKLRETFQNILPRYFSSKNRIAMSLTGGLDTRMIMAWQKHESGELPCYTFGGMYRDCFDVKVARKVAEACHQKHEVITLDKRFLNDYPYYVQKTIYITDGYLDATGAYEVYLNRLARDFAPIRMTGNYGSEVLRGVNYIKANPPDGRLFHPDFNTFIQKAVKTFNDMNAGHQLSYAVFKLIPWLLYGRLASAQSQLTLRTPYMDNELVGLLYRSPEDARKTREISLRLINDGSPNLAGIMTDRGVGGGRNSLYSKSARLYYESLFKLEYYYNIGMPQWLAGFDFSLRPLHLDKLFLGRHKIDHFRIWFRDDLSDYVKDTLLDKRTAQRPFFNKKSIEESMKGHIKGNRNNTNAINAILTAELIYRALID